MLQANGQAALVVVCNFTKATYENYKVGVPDFEY
ncbi:alpha amylase C-terminal domain-containing protein, partial [Bacillus sp. D-CC]